MCALIDEHQRAKLYKYFWSLTWPEKREHVKGLVATRKVRKRRGEKKKITINAQGSNKKKGKQCGHDIYLAKEDGEKVRVCRMFFLSTLNLDLNYRLERRRKEPTRNS